MHKWLYDAMHEKLQRPYAKNIFKKRRSTLAPLSGTMLNIVNLKHVNPCGIKHINNHCIMSAINNNIKRHLKFTKTKRKNACRRLLKNTVIANEWIFQHFIYKVGSKAYQITGNITRRGLRYSESYSVK